MSEHNLSPEAVLLFNALAKALGNNLPTQVAQPAAAQYGTTRKAAPKAVGTLTVLAVRGEGVAVQDSFEGELQVSNPRAKKVGTGVTHDCALTVNGKVAANFTLSPDAYSRLAQKGTRVYLGERCYKLTLKH
jgi:hypothetical protein